MKAGVHTVTLFNTMLPACLCGVITVVLAFGTRLALTQRLPPRTEELASLHANHQEIFYDTKAIPDGVEVSAFLYRNEMKR